MCGTSAAAHPSPFSRAAFPPAGLLPSAPFLTRQQLGWVAEAASRKNWMVSRNCARERGGGAEHAGWGLRKETKVGTTTAGCSGSDARRSRPKPNMRTTGVGGRWLTQACAGVTSGGARPSPS